MPSRKASRASGGSRFAAFSLGTYDLLAANFPYSLRKPPARQDSRRARHGQRGPHPVESLTYASTRAIQPLSLALASFSAFAAPAPRPPRRRPAQPRRRILDDDPAALLGLSLGEAFARFGAPASVMRRTRRRRMAGRRGLRLRKRIHSVHVRRQALAAPLHQALRSARSTASSSATARTRRSPSSVNPTITAPVSCCSGCPLNPIRSGSGSPCRTTASSDAYLYRADF